MRTGIAKYDEDRVVLVPMNGIPEDYAKFIKETAMKHGWTDLKIAKTRDVHQTLVVICKPQTWKNFVTLMKVRGHSFPDGYLDRFDKECKLVMGDYKEAEIHKEPLTKEEQDIKKRIVEHVRKKEERGDYELQDKLEEERDKTWELVETKKKKNG